MLLNSIGLALFLYSFKNFRTAFKLFLMYSVFWASQGLLFSISGRNIIMSFAMSAGFLLSFIFYIRKNPLAVREPMPFTVPFLIIGFSMFISCFTASAGFTSDLARVISTFFRTYTIIWISWYTLNTKEDFSFLLKGLIIVFLVAGIYAIIESIVRVNPFFEYKKAISYGLLPQYKTKSRGYRIISIFDHSIGAGFTIGLFVSFILVVTVNNIELLPYRKLAFFTALLLIPCIVLTKIRMPIIFTVIASLPFLNTKSRNFKYVFILVLVLCILISPLLFSNRNLFLSAVSLDAQNTIKGSTFAMRKIQFKSVWLLIKDHPLTGLGEKFRDYISNELTDAALGYESIWLEQLSKHGIIGCIAYLITIIYTTVLIPVKYKSKEVLFLGLAYWLSYSLTTTLAFNHFLYYVFIFFYIKMKKYEPSS